MINSSTLRKLQATGTMVYRVTVPATTITMGLQSVAVPALVEYFSDKAAAVKAAAQYRTIYGNTVDPVVDPVAASVVPN